MTPEEILERVGAVTGTVFSYGGRCRGGQVGAHYAADRSGQDYVFKWFEGASDGDWRLRIPDRAERLRARGYPAPRYLASIPSGDILALLQERVQGECSDEVDQALVDRVVAINDLQRDQGRGDRDWTDYIRWTLVEGADWYCVHEPMRRYSDETRRMLDVIESVGRNLGRLPGNDLVHFDLTHRNLLRTTAGDLHIVDCDALDDGDRLYDLVTFTLSFRTVGVDPGVHQGVEPGVDDDLWERLHVLIPADAFTAYVAHMVRRRVEWKIRLSTKADADAIIPRMARRLAEVT